MTLKTNNHAGLSVMRKRCIALVATAVIGLAVVIPAAIQAQAVPGGARSFFQSLAGEWIGTCEQSTDGQKAENKYFHVLVKQVNANTYQSNFDYYRSDPRTGAPVPIGQSAITTTINADGSASNKITGKGIMYVDKKLKNQDHVMQEVIRTSAYGGGMQGQGTGKLNVYGMPLGLGKGGKIKDEKSTWSLNNGVLKIDQRLTAAFKAFFMTKKFAFAASYTARRGTNVAQLMTRPTQVSYKP